MRRNRRVSAIGTWVFLGLAVGSLTIVSAAAGNGWGNDREPDMNDAQCDDDEGTGNDWKCEGGARGSGGSGSGGGGHGWGNDREPDMNDAQCDDDEGTGNDWKCTGEEK